MKVDYLGNEINVGDKVVFCQLNYRNFFTGRISKITDKMVVIDHERTNTGSTQTKQYPSQVIKI